MKNILLFVALFLWIGTSSTLSAQPCPGNVTKSSNSGCFLLSWTAPPSPLPMSFTTSSGTYSFSFGPGTTSSPAEYLRDGGNGRCNGHQSAFTGTITFPNAPACIYLNGSNTNPPLPVTLVKFEVRSHAQEVSIEWSTSSELFNRAFLLQRSTDGIDWKEIAEVPGRGTTQEFHTYRVLDQNPEKGLNYYRLVQEDIDGKRTFFPVKTIRMTVEGQEFQVYPNPARSLITISSPDDGEYAIMTTTGKIVQQGIFQNGQSLDVSGLSPGFYLVRVQANGLESTQRLVIRE